MRFPGCISITCARATHGPLEGVFYHNAMDVVAMAALLNHMSEMMANPYEGRVQHGLDFIALGKLFEDLDHLGGSCAPVRAGTRVRG